jgi:peptidyl-prolyl cis-trans isomerase A (cyclophilin A)
MMLVLSLLCVALASRLPCDAPSTFNVQFTLLFKSPNPPTSKVVVLEVIKAWAPIGVQRFWELLKAHYYDSNGLFRVVPGFVIQWGIAALPAVSERWNVTIKDDPVVASNVRGTIAYATGGPNTRTTQLYVNLGNNSRLDAEGFAPFAKVTSGMDVFDAVYAGYGQNPDQNTIYSQGNAYLQSQFPLLTYIETAKVIQ